MRTSANQLTLFCLPYAGGSRYSYREFERLSPPSLNIKTLEYPGRGSRLNEPLRTEISLLVEDLYQQILPFLNEGCYALYGHSMGGLMAYLLTQKIVQQGKQEPRHLFITGSTAPLAKSKIETKIHLLNKVDFIEELRKLKGCPEEILNDRDVFDYFEPILRADFEAIETFVYVKSSPVNIPMTVITGTHEEFEDNDIHLWQLETRSTFVFRKFPGYHFFIFQYPQEIIRVISNTLHHTE